MKWRLVITVENFKRLSVTRKQEETLLEFSAYSREADFQVHKPGEREEPWRQNICTFARTRHSLTFLMQASPASCSSLFVEFRALKSAAMIFSLDWGR